MKKKAAITNDFRAESQPLRKLYLLERRNMTEAGSYSSAHPNRYGTRGKWQLFDAADDYADALDMFSAAAKDYNMRRDYDWRLSEWTASDGPDGAVFSIKTVSELDTDQAADRNFLEKDTEDADETLESESEDQFADLQYERCHREEDLEEKADANHYPSQANEKEVEQ